MLRYVKMGHFVASFWVISMHVSTLLPVRIVLSGFWLVKGTNFGTLRATLTVLRLVYLFEALGGGCGEDEHGGHMIYIDLHSSTYTLFMRMLQTQKIRVFHSYDSWLMT